MAIFVHQIMVLEEGKSYASSLWSEKLDRTLSRLFAVFFFLPRSESFHYSWMFCKKNIVGQASNVGNRFKAHTCFIKSFGANASFDCFICVSTANVSRRLKTIIFSIESFLILGMILAKFCSLVYTTFF